MRTFALALAAGLAACSSQQPKAKAEPTPVEIATQITAQAEEHAKSMGGTVGSVTIEFVEPPDDVWVDMAVVAAGWAKSYLAPRTVGIYQAESAEPRFRRAVEAVTNRFALRPIAQSDFSVVCSGNTRSRNSMTTPTAQCSMKYVDAVVGFNSIRIGRDTGYVGVGITRVPNGATRAEQVYYCITLGKKAGEWAFKRSERVIDPQRCFRRMP